MTLREKILDYIRRCRLQGGNVFCTWWFRFDVMPHTTKEIRRELGRMEKEGLVISDRSQRNNTKWSLTEEPR